MSRSTSPSLSSRILGLGRRVTLPVQPAQPQPASVKKTSTLEISTLSYNPPSLLDPSAFPSIEPLLPPRHRTSLPADLSPSPYSPSPHPLSVSRHRSCSAASAASPAHHPSHPSLSSSSSSSSSTSSSSTTPPQLHSPSPPATLLSPSPPSLPARSLLHQGPVRKQSPSPPLHLWQSRYLWLYSDALHYGKSRDSRTLQGRILLTSVKFVLQLGTGGGGGGRGRFDVVVGEETIARTFHFEGRDERDAEGWVRHITQAMQGVGVVASHTATLQPQPKWWKTGGESGVEKGSRPSIKSRVAINATPSLSALPLPPSPAPMTPLHAPKGVGRGELEVVQGWGAGGEVSGIEAVLEVVEAVELHHVGRMFLCRERVRPDVWHLLHSVPLSHPLAPLVRVAHHRMAQLHPLPHLLTPVCHSSSLSDALLAVYTPALHPSHTLSHLLQMHRRLPSPVVLHIAIQLTRALTALHSCGHHYPALSPSSLAFDGDGSLTLIDPLFSLPPPPPPHHPLPPYTLPPLELEAVPADWWRLGILLYELSVGLPPLRAGDEGGKSEGEEGEEGGKGGGWEGWHPLGLVFPPFVGDALQSLIRQLMMAEVEERLGCGEGGEVGVTAHPFFAGVDWDADLPPPAWVKQHVMKQAVRTSLTVSAGTAMSAPSPAVSTTPPSPSTAFTFSPRDHTPSTTKGVGIAPFFPSSLVVAGPSPLDAYLQQKPPRNVIFHPPSAAPSTPPTSLQLTLLGGRNFPPPSSHAHPPHPNANPFKRRSTLLDAAPLYRSSSSSSSSSSSAFPSAVSPSVATHGVYVTVTCAGVACTSRMVVGPAACHPHFGDVMRWGLGEVDEAGEGVWVGSAGWEEGEVEMEVKWGRIGAVTGAAGVPGANSDGVTVGSVSLSLASVQAMCGGVEGEMWHSMIDAQGLVVGELHVQWRWEREGDGQGPWWVRLRGEGKGDGPTFQNAFGRALEGEEQGGEGVQERGEVKVERGEEDDASDVRVHLGGALST